MAILGGLTRTPFPISTGPATESPIPMTGPLPIEPIRSDRNAVILEGSVSFEGVGASLFFSILPSLSMIATLVVVAPRSTATVFPMMSGFCPA
jgi:hypothetical protein